MNVMTSLKLASQSHFCLGVLLFTLRGSGTLCLGLEHRGFLMALSKPELTNIFPQDPDRAVAAVCAGAGLWFPHFSKKGSQLFSA